MQLSDRAYVSFIVDADVGRPVGAHRKDGAETRGSIAAIVVAA